MDILTILYGRFKREQTITVSTGEPNRIPVTTTDGTLDKSLMPKTAATKADAIAYAIALG